MDAFEWPLDTSGFVPRWNCGLWSTHLGWLHIASDSLIWLAYLAIPAILLYFLRKRRDIPFPKILWLFGAFIIACGTTHLIEAVIFWEPIYRLDGLVKALTAVISWVTVFCLIPVIPQALSMRTPKELELDVSQRTAELQQTNERLQREVEERLRVESQIRQQQEWLQVILRSIGDGIIACDESHRVTLLNPAAESITGLRQSDVVGQPLDKVLHFRTEWSHGPFSLRSFVRPGLLSNSNNSQLTTNDGSERIVECEINPIRHGDSKTAGEVITIRDVTDQKAAEASLRLRDRAISAANQGILITDATGQDHPIVYVSAGFERITGYSASEVIGLNCRFLQGPESDPIKIRQIRECVSKAEPCTAELINYRKDGSPFWNELSISPVRDAAGRLTHFVGVQTDITQRKSLEEQLQQAQKLESVGRLAGGVAHDFNNMLTVIQGCSEMVLSELAAGDPKATLLEEIRTATEQAANMTRQLLAFSRRQVVSYQSLDLNAIARETETMLGRLLGEDVELELALAADLWQARGDRGQMQQVLINLAVNARDAMPEGGKLSIATQNVPHCPFDGGEGPGVLVEVRDTGSGIDEASLASLFEPFFTTKPVGRGTGLGLAVVHGIVTQAGGRIEVKTRLGLGTAFRVYLQRDESHPSHVVSPAAADDRLPTGSETVLVVEDEIQVRTLICSVLEKSGYRVLAAENGNEAKRLWSDGTLRIGLLVTDVVMPGMKGSEVAAQFAIAHPQAKVLYVSGYTDDTLLGSGISHDGFNYLQKPFSPAMLARKIRETLDAPA